MQGLGEKAAKPFVALQLAGDWTDASGDGRTSILSVTRRWRAGSVLGGVFSRKYRCTAGGARARFRVAPSTLILRSVTSRSIYTRTLAAAGTTFPRPHAPAARGLQLAASRCRLAFVRCSGRPFTPYTAPSSSSPRPFVLSA